MVSFTGSTTAGIDVAKRAVDNVKRVHQELGGKSPNVILDDADLVRQRTRMGRNRIRRIPRDESGHSRQRGLIAGGARFDVRGSIAGQKF
jgi:aldehyde dehydrogenase (NAD+)